MDTSYIAELVGKNAIAERGFTLIELSIVLVIIGLLVGGVLVGRDLIKAAGTRATITQIEKFNTAANTFFGKYGYLPGDIKDPDASQFGFQARGSNPGQGDGNGVIAGYSGTNVQGFNQAGETLMFWVDLSTAHLIEGTYNSVTPGFFPSSPYISGASTALYIPPAKLGGGNYIYAFSGNWNSNQGGVMQTPVLNYFGLSNVASIGQSSCSACLFSQPGLTVQQAYSIDQKIDDGLPLSGRVVSVYLSSNNWFWGNQTGSSGNLAAPSGATPGSSTTCFDNGNNANAVQQYSVEISGGSNINCPLAFKMQAGD